MRKQSKPAYWGRNAARNAEKRFLREKKTAGQRVDETRKATADVFVMCILSAVYDTYSIGETRLHRVVDAANERAVRYTNIKNGLPRLVDGKRRTGPEIAEMELDKDVKEYFPSGFVLPAHKMAKKRDLLAVYEQRRAAATVAKLYAYGLHQALGFGPERMETVMREAVKVYEKFREWADDGDYYGYKMLARKMEEILRCPCEVNDTEAKEPVFGATLD